MRTVCLDYETLIIGALQILPTYRKWLQHIAMAFFPLASKYTEMVEQL